MTKSLIALLSALCIASTAHAQTSWWRTYGGANDDEGYSVQQTSDGGYIVAGYTASYGNGGDDVYLIKTNSHGDTLWTRTFGGGGNDIACSVEQTRDSGYITVGHTRSFGAGSYDVYLIKTNGSGDTLWTRTYGGSGYDTGSSVQQTTDGGYIITGYTESYGSGGSDVYLVKTNAQGDSVWTRTYGGTHDDAGSSVLQTTDGGYIVAGSTASFGAGSQDVYLIKTDAQGDTLWTRTYGGSHDDYGYSCQQTADGGYAIAGCTFSFGPGIPSYGNVYLIKTDVQGDTLWTRTIGGEYHDAGYSLQQTTDGGYITAGMGAPVGGGLKVYLIKTNGQGNTLWTRYYRALSWGLCTQQTSDSGYIVAGATYTSYPDCDVYLIKTDSLGNVAGIVEPSTQHPVSPTCLLVQPNPFTSVARVPGHETELFTLSDVAGRQVAVCKGDRIGAGLRPGVYFLSPRQGDLSRHSGQAATIIKAES